MKHNGYIITAVNRLTGKRDQISAPMEKPHALQQLEEERRRRKKRRHAAYTRLKVKELQPVN